jgi:cellulose biosynthesis protein BcsQ
MHESIPILLIANLKGGVGKSTIAANLVPYFEREHNESVLAIDLDYQGSLSSMLLPEPYNRQPRTAQTLKDLLSGRADNLAMLGMSRPIRDTIRDSRIIDCDSPFANFETRLLIQWLCGEVDGDIRYGLARALHDQAIQERFQRVIIDAPPRMTTGFVNALCASTHLVVPFVLDTLSAERVGLFINQLQRMKPQLFPHLNLAGVVGTMKRTDTDQIGDTERAAFNEAKTRVQQSWGSSDYVLTQAAIPRKQSIADAAGLRIAYNESSDAESIFKRLGSHLIVRAPGRQHASHVISEAAE